MFMLSLMWNSIAEISVGTTKTYYLKSIFFTFNFNSLLEYSEWLTGNECYKDQQKANFLV